MHRALHIPEVLQEVIYILSPQEEQERHLKLTSKISEKLADLASMARTCQCFYEPAMNALWRVLYDPKHLLGSLKGRASHSDTSNLRLLANAARVRVFHYDETPPSRSMFRIVRRIVPTDAILFPNLCRLTLAYPSGPPGMENVITLLNCKPADIHILYPVERSYADSIWNELTQRCSTVVDLYLRVDGDLEMPFTLPAVHLLTDLKTLNITPTCMRSEDIVTLSKLPHLQRLTICIPPTFSLSGSAVPEPSFPSLTSLELHAVSNHSSFAEFSRLISRHMLLDLSLEFHVDNSSVTWVNKVLEAISSFSNLEWLSLLDAILLSAARPEGNVPYDIRPLFRLRRLEKFVVTLPGVENAVTDEAIPAFGEAWPHLAYLEHMQIPGKGMRSAGLTLKALPLCARHLPKLLFLALQLDASEIPDEDLPAARSECLDSLELTGSLIDEAKVLEIAAYISGIYPDAVINMYGEELYKWDKAENSEEENKEFEKWQNIDDALAVMSRVRKQERRIALKDVQEDSGRPSGLQ